MNNKLIQKRTSSTGVFLGQAIGDKQKLNLFRMLSLRPNLPPVNRTGLVLSMFFMMLSVLGC